jgi:hypothetical protein
MGLRNPLLALLRRRRSAVVVPREDASHRPLQPTCCHEYPLEHATPKLRALTLPTAATCPALPPEPSLDFPNATVHSDVDWPLPASSTLSGDAVDAAPPAAASPITPKGRPVSRTRCSRGHCPPRTGPMSQLAGTPCRPFVPSPASRGRSQGARTLFTSRPSRPHPIPKARGAFHRQVPSAPPRAFA